MEEFHFLLLVLSLFSCFMGSSRALGPSPPLNSLKKKKIFKAGFSNGSSSFKGKHRKISYSEIHSATNGFNSENLIGRGGSGSVYRGIIVGERGTADVVAIKVFDLKQKQALKSFVAECKALRSIRHRNLVKIITSCSSIDHRGVEFKAVVMDFMINGSLDQWLYPENMSGSGLSLIQRLNIVIDVASAVDYLHHDCDPPVVHCDLKPSNVLLDTEMIAHVGDFGLARLLFQNHLKNQSCTIELKGSIGYIAPEPITSLFSISEKRPRGSENFQIYNSSFPSNLLSWSPEYGFGGKVSTSGDVYSFGILLLEIFTGKKPTDEVFRIGLDMNKFATAVRRNQVTDIVDPSLLEDNSIFTDRIININPHTIANSTSSNNSTSSTQHNTYNVMESNWRSRKEECLVALIRLGLSCATKSTKERPSMRGTLSKLRSIKSSLLQLRGNHGC
ncbi:putative LRR receptor-like serine/threonine-protein kinase At3g47570 [Tasmannia lanceolata]|uniref:putative LRR receptor-like serine/threonine-protein kinase At3g47570 n=1 Tax=Tasmannia lanceolata TaxID=3420 RepID=UPI0040631511